MAARLTEIDALGRLLGTELPDDFEMKIEIITPGGTPQSGTLKMTKGTLTRKLGRKPGGMLSCW